MNSPTTPNPEKMAGPGSPCSAWLGQPTWLALPATAPEPMPAPGNEAESDQRRLLAPWRVPNANTGPKQSQGTLAAASAVVVKRTVR